MASLGRKLVGEPPGKDAPRAAKLRWIRGIYFKQLPFVILVYAILAVEASGVVLALAGVSALIWLQGFISLSWRIRREEHPHERTNLKG